MNKNRMRVKEYRATMKSLAEQRADLQVELEGILDGAKAETRALTQEEQDKFADVEGQIKAIDATIEAEERARVLQPKKQTETRSQEEKTEEAEIRAFANYIRGKAGLQVERRAGEQNLDMENNSGIIPVTIANRIIKKVRDICPIYARATVYHVKGTLKIPVWGKANKTHDIAVGYQEEFNELTADAGAFSTVDLSGYLVGALALIGKSVANNSDIALVDFVVSQMAEEIAVFLEKELLTGTGVKSATGALNTETTTVAAASDKVTADELIDLQAKIKQVFQGNACWIMHSDTFTSVKKLKDANGRYLLQDDITGDFPYRMLGKPVFLSDNMPKMEAGQKAFLYGDLTGLSVNMREDIQIQILIEKYATMHALGVVGWFEFDSKVSDHQRMATLSMKAA